MKLTLVQMSMTESMDENLAKSLCACDKTKDSDLIFFPEIQLSPFFPQYEKRDASRYLVTMDSPYVTAFIYKAKEINSCIVPNVYMKIDNKCYDCCFVTIGTQVVHKIAKMVHIAQAENFYEQDYYTPSDVEHTKRNKGQPIIRQMALFPYTIINSLVMRILETTKEEILWSSVLLVICSINGNLPNRFIYLF